MALRFKAATSLSVILFIAFVLELLAVLSVPVTSKISLSTFHEYKFGVFGYCNTQTNTCSGIGIGYSIPDDDNKFKLPSSARRSLSNLLIVHVVAAALTFILFVCALLAHIHGPGSSQRYLLCLILLVLPSFLISLLAFLVDILLFVSHLDWGGWIMLAATVLTAFSGILLCLMRRTLSSQKAMKRRANANANAELQDISFSPTKFQDDDLPPISSRTYSEIKFQPTNTSGDDAVPLNRAESDGRVGDFSFNSAITDSASYINPERTPSPSREYRHTNTGFAYRGGYTQTGDGPSNQLEFTSPNGVNISPNRSYGSVPMGSTPTRPAPPQVVPAGTYVPGVEESGNIGYGPNVVPLPRIRQVNHQQPHVHQPAQPQQQAQEGPLPGSESTLENTSTYSQHPPYGEYPPRPNGPPNNGSNYSNNLPVMNRRPSGPRMPPMEGTTAVIENSGRDMPAQSQPAYVPPRQLWQQQQQPRQEQQQQPQQQPHQEQQQQPRQEQYQSPPPTQPRRASQTYRQFFVEDEQHLPPDSAPTFQSEGPARGPLGNDNVPLQPPGGGDHEVGYNGPASPAASDTSSNYTSISQRPVNPQYYQPQRGPDRSEFVLQSNPDFDLGLPTTRKKNVAGPRGPRGPGGRSGKLPAASQSSDGPYGFSR